MALGLSSAALAFEVPALTGPVVDEAGILNPATKRQLEGALHDFLRQNGIQLQIYITKSLQNEPIENVSIKVFDQWKIGDEKFDKGLLFLIAPSEKKLRIEVGQGLEGDLPDVIAKRIISDVVVPYFKRGEFSLGILQGVSSIQAYVLNTDTAVTKADKPVTESKGSGWLILIVIGIWLIIFMLNPSLALHLLFAAMNSRGGSGGGGGGWSGGGGRSSGGGASGGW